MSGSAGQDSGKRAAAPGSRDAVGQDSADVLPGKDRAGAIATAVTAAIVEQRLPPGTKLSEDELGATFGVSRTIVRAALRSLQAERLVTIWPNRGAFVASPSVEEARQVFHARRVVEGALIRDAARRCTAEHAAVLRSHLAQESAALSRGDRSAAIRLSGDFHRRIGEMAEQDVLLHFVGELISRSALVIALYGTTRASSCGTSEHEALVEALEAHDADRAEALMMHHLAHVEADLDLGRAGGATVDLASVLAGR
jgi:DNA-binding GntR family transcriptional regulator